MIHTIKIEKLIRDKATNFSYSELHLNFRSAKKKFDHLNTVGRVLSMKNTGIIQGDKFEITLHESGEVRQSKLIES